MRPGADPGGARQSVCWCYSAGMLSTLAAVLALALMILVHELGHFLVAKACGMRVERFSLGFGRPLLHFTRGETTYQLALVPLGGFVQITGMNPFEDYDQDDPRVFSNRPRWMRLSALLAGPGANYLMASLLGLMLFSAKGLPVPMPGSDKPVVAQLSPGMPAEAAGLMPGDRILSLNGKALTVDRDLVTAVKEATGAAVGSSAGSPPGFSAASARSGDAGGEDLALALVVDRGGVEKRFSIAPKFDPKTKRHLIGVAFDYPGNLGAAARYAFINFPLGLSEQMLKGFGRLLTAKEDLNALSGPIGIGSEIKRAAEKGFWNYIQIIAFVSIALGLFNLLPLPALDGGRILFLLAGYLGLRGLSEKAEAKVHMAGLVFLMAVLVMVTVNDAFRKPSPDAGPSAATPKETTKDISNAKTAAPEVEPQTAE